MLHLFRIALAMLLLGSLSACMKPSDLADGADYYLRDAGVLDHSASQRSNNRRIQADSFIYIGQGPVRAAGLPVRAAERGGRAGLRRFRRVFPAGAPRQGAARPGRRDARGACRRRSLPAVLPFRPGRQQDRQLGGVEDEENSAGSGAIAVSSRSC